MRQAFNLLLKFQTEIEMAVYKNCKVPLFQALSVVITPTTALSPLKTSFNTDLKREIKSYFTKERYKFDILLT